MQEQPPVVLSKETAERTAAYDHYCKTVLSRKVVLAHILKEYMPEFAGCSLEDIRDKYIKGTPEVASIPVNPDDVAPIITGMRDEDISPECGRVTCDIVFTVLLPGSDEHVGMIINIEAQKNNTPGYPLTKRAFYYCARLLAGQYGRYFKKSKYGNLRKVYSVWLLPRPQAGRENTANVYEITERNLIRTVVEPVSHYDLMTVIMVSIGNPKSRECADTLKLLGTLLRMDLTGAERHSILTEFSDMQKAVVQEVPEMCNLGMGIYEDGMEKRAFNTTITNIKNLMESLPCPLDRAMALLRIPTDDQPKYAAALSK